MRTYFINRVRNTKNDLMRMGLMIKFLTAQSRFLVSSSSAHVFSVALPAPMIVLPVVPLTLLLQLLRVVPVHLVVLVSVLLVLLQRCQLSIPRLVLEQGQLFYNTP